MVNLMTMMIHSKVTQNTIYSVSTVKEKGQTHILLISKVTCSYYFGRLANEIKMRRHNCDRKI